MVCSALFCQVFDVTKGYVRTLTPKWLCAYQLSVIAMHPTDGNLYVGLANGYVTVIDPESGLTIRQFRSLNSDRVTDLWAGTTKADGDVVAIRFDFFGHLFFCTFSDVMCVHVSACRVCAVIPMVVLEFLHWTETSFENCPRRAKMSCITMVSTICARVFFGTDTGSLH